MSSHARSASAPVGGALLVIAGIAALALAGGIVRVPWLWGLDAAAWWPAWMQATVAIVLALGFAIAIPAREWVTSTDAPTVRRRVLLATLAAVVFVGIGATAGPRTRLLGDGQLLTRDFALALDGDPDVSVRSWPAILQEDHVAPATTLLQFAVVRVAHAWFGADAVRGLEATSLLVGAGFAFLTVLLVVGLPWPRDLVAWTLVLAWLAPTTVFFLGYVENYALLQLGVGLYVLAGVGAIAGRGSPTLATAVLLLAIASHVQAITLLPSLVLVWWSRVPARRRVFLVRTWPGVATSACVLGALTLTHFAPSLPLLPSMGSTLTWWSPRHVVDVIQVVLVAFPLAPLAVVAVRWRDHHVPLPLGHPGRAARAFASLLVGPPLVYLLFADPELGMARDWDRAGFLAWGWTAQLLLTLAQARRAGTLDAGGSLRLLAPATGVLLAVGIPWIALQHDEARMLARTEWIVDADPHARTHGYEALARFHADREQYGPAAHWAGLAYETTRNPRLATLAAQHLRRVGREDQARALLETALARRPGDHRVRYELLLVVTSEGDWEHALELATEGRRRHPGQAVYCVFEGESLLRLAREAESVEILEGCLLLPTMPPATRDRITAILAAHRRE